jgi:hypothetical protein
MPSQDILLDNNYDLMCVNGDIAIGLSEQQHIALIVVTAQGHWKENPFLGFNAAIYLGSNTPASIMTGNLSEQLVSDNTVLDQLTVNQSGEIINVLAHRLVD